MFLCYGDGRRALSEGKVLLNTKFENVEKSNEFYVASNKCPYETILGVPWFRTMEIKLEFGPEEYCIESAYRPNKLYLANEVTIPARHSKAVELKGEMLDGPLILNEARNNENRFGYRLLRGLANLSQGKVMAVLANPTYSEMKLPKGLAVAKDGEDYEGVEYEHLKSKVEIEEISISDHLSPREKAQVQKLIKEYQDRFDKDRQAIHGERPKVEHQIKIIPNSKPVKSRCYKVPIHLEPKFEAEIKQMLDDKIIRPSQSSYSSPVSVLRKPDGSIRVICDYRKLNDITERDLWPIPNINRLLTRLRKSKYFTVLDLYRGFYQIKLAPDAIDKTAILTHLGLFEFLVVPFGCRNGSATCQRLMQSIFGNHQNIECYIDDLVIHSEDFESHIRHVREALEKLRENSLIVNLRKCHFFFDKVQILGHTVAQNEIAPIADKVKQIRETPTPRNFKELRSFISFANYYRRFCKNFAQKAKALYDLQKSNRWHWTQEHTDAFNTIRNAVTEDSVIRPFAPNCKTTIHVDSSYAGLGAILEQVQDGKRYIIEFASRTLKDNEQKLSASELECLGLLFACDHWRHYLLGLDEVTVFTDHHCLCYLFKIQNASGKLTRWAIALSEFPLKIVYRKGSENCADYLSRYPGFDTKHWKEEDKPCITRIPERKMMAIDHCHFKDLELKTAQKHDTWCRNAYKTVQEDPLNAPYAIHKGVLYKKKRDRFGLKYLVCIPRRIVKDLIYWCHDVKEAGHMGRDRTIAKIKERFFWPTVYRDVSNYISTCHVCQLNKDINEKKKGALQSVEPGGFFEHISIDILGSLKETREGYKFILTIVEHSTRWADAVALKRITASSIVDQLLERVFLRYGTPAEIQSDNGKQFTAQLNQEIVENLHSRACYSSTYHSQAQGLTERWNKTLTSILRSFVNQTHSNWPEFVPWAVWAYNTTIQNSTGLTPYECLFGRKPCLTIDYLVEGMREINHQYAQAKWEAIEEIRRIARAHIIEAQIKQQERHARSHDTHTQYRPGDLVLIKRNLPVSGLTTKMLQTGYGPFRVIRQVGAVNYRIDLGVGGQQTIHVEKLSRYRKREPEITKNVRGSYHELPGGAREADENVNDRPERPFDAQGPRHDPRDPRDPRNGPDNPDPREGGRLRAGASGNEQISAQAGSQGHPHTGQRVRFQDPLREDVPNQPDRQMGSRTVQRNKNEKLMRLLWDTPHPNRKSADDSMFRGARGPPDELKQKINWQTQRAPTSRDINKDWTIRASKTNNPHDMSIEFQDQTGRQQAESSQSSAVRPHVARSPITNDDSFLEAARWNLQDSSTPAKPTTPQKNPLFHRLMGRASPSPDHTQSSEEFNLPEWDADESILERSHHDVSTDDAGFHTPRSSDHSRSSRDMNLDQSTDYSQERSRETIRAEHPGQLQDQSRDQLHDRSYEESHDQSYVQSQRQQQEASPPGAAAQIVPPSLPPPVLAEEAQPVEPVRRSTRERKKPEPLNYNKLGG